MKKRGVLQCDMKRDWNSLLILIGVGFIFSFVGGVNATTSISDNEINTTGNVTIGDKITFALGQIIDNIVDGFIRVTGGFNVVNSSNTSQSFFFINNSTGNVGIGTTSPGAKLTVGSGAASNSADAQILITRDVDDTVVGNGHAFSDSSDITRSGGTTAYNSFDARVDFEGANDYHHYAAFQANPDYGSSGTILHCYGLYSRPTVSAGTISNSYGLFVDDPDGVGAVTNNYGVYIPNLVKGSTINYAIYTAGTTRSVFEGIINAKGGLAVGSPYFTPDKTLQVQSASGIETSFRLRQTAKNYWDFTIPADSTHFQIGDVGGVRLTILSPSGNVGIGTTAPTHKLNVIGGVNITSGLIVGNNSQQANITLYSPDGSAWNCGVDNSGAFACS
jgi:hypothetical protein